MMQQKQWSWVPVLPGEESTHNPDMEWGVFVG